MPARAQAFQDGADRPQPALHPQQLTIGTGTQAVFGVGAVAGLAEAVKSLGGSRVFVVTDAGLVASGVVAPVTAGLSEAGLEVAVYSELRPTPASDDIAAGGRVLRNFGQAVVVGLGGG